MTVIGIGCKARQGKDTLATAIHALLPKRSKIYHFADSLKVYCRLQGWMTSKDGRVLQTVGDLLEEHRIIDALDWQIREEKPDIAIVADLRTIKEYQWVHEYEGTTVRVVRMMPDHTQYIDPSRPANHHTEVQLDKIKFDVHVSAGDGHLDMLDIAARTILENLGYGADLPIV